MGSREQRLAIVVVARDLASKSLRNVNREIDRMAGKKSPLAQMGSGAGTLAGGLVRVGVIAAGAFAGGIIAAAKAGMDFEDAFAGVRKTVEGTPKQLDDLALALRSLATRIPVTAVDLANLATQAGALGVAAPNVAIFTEAVARVVAAGTGLEINDVADAFGKLGTIFRLNGPDYERLGSALVYLGNNAASSEVDIVSIARRFAAAGQEAGLSADKVLGWSSAIASVGVLPEAAGSAMSRLFNNMTRFAAMGDGKLKAWAKTAHMTFSDFTKLVHDDANGAMLLFIKNLSKLDRFDAARVLREGGIINTRDINAILLLSQHYDLLTKSLGDSAKAYKDNTYLQSASEKRFDTLKSRVTLFISALKEAGIEISEGLLPAVGHALNRIRELLSLPSSKNELRQLGKDLGAAIENINWSNVLQGIKDVAHYAKVAFDLIRQIPPEITAGIVGFAGINKLSGGLIGAGVSDIVGGLIRQFMGRGSPVNPMWVAVVGGGLGGPGGIPGKGGIPMAGVGAAIAIEIQPALDFARDTAQAAHDAAVAAEAAARGRSRGGYWGGPLGPGGLPQNLRADHGGAGSAVIKNTTPIWLREMVSMLRRISKSGSSDYSQLSATVKAVLGHSEGGSKQTLNGILDNIKAQRAVALRRGDKVQVRGLDHLAADVAARLGRVILAHPFNIYLPSLPSVTSRGTGPDSRAPLPHKPSVDDRGGGHPQNSGRTLGIFVKTSISARESDREARVWARYGNGKGVTVN